MRYLILLLLLPLFSKAQTNTFVDVDSVFNLINNLGNQINMTVIKAEAVLDFPSTSAANGNSLTVSVPGAEINDAVALGLPTASVMDNSAFTAWVSDTNVVTVRFHNYGTLTSKNPESGTFLIRVLK